MATPEAFRTDNLHGRRTIPGAMAMVPTRRHREITHARKTFLHRAKNGVYDPITFYHVLDALLDLKPDQMFRAIEFVRFLRETRFQLVWDTTTIGRVLTDMAESLNEVNASSPIDATRRWNGMTYTVSSKPEDRRAMENLLDDLSILCNEELTAELGGEFPKRTQSPLTRCPSLLMLSV